MDGFYVVYELDFDMYNLHIRVFDLVNNIMLSCYYDVNIFEEIYYEITILLYGLLAIHFFHVFVLVLILPTSLEFEMVVLVEKKTLYFM
jgi:hypothetical protein